MIDHKLKILHLEDLPSDAELVRRALVKGKMDFDLLLTDNRDGFLNALDNYKPDIILSDHSLPSFDSIEAITIVKEKQITVPFILITATISEEFAVEVMKEGAWDYILKDRLQRLPNAIKNALEKHRIDTERKKILDHVIANEALYKEAERIARFGTWHSDQRSGRTVMSEGSYRILGYEPNEISPSANFFLQSIYPDDLLEIQKLFSQSAPSPETKDIDFRMKDKYGNTIYVNSQFQIKYDAKGMPASIIGFNQDITKQKEAELKIMQLTQTLEKKVAERTSQLEQSIKELESFSYSVSHDLRAPLRVINGYSKLLMDEHHDTLEPEAIDYIRTVNENAIQMGQLIEDLLNLSRLGLESLDKTEVDMKTLVEMTLYEHKLSHENTPDNITIGDLHPAVCSRNLMKQVWVNLLTNAIKYSSKKENPSIQISSYITEGEIVYFIKDNGAGFDMKFADRLFGVFQRLHNKQDFEGTGVGLALVHRIISRHGGRVWAEGVPDKGATFYFTLPR